MLLSLRKIGATFGVNATAKWSQGGVSYVAVDARTATIRPADGFVKTVEPHSRFDSGGHHGNT
jgi:hypothetical protein